ncbi:DUF3298 domain-containing protein [Candidatus Margulisiibacteriota bacterium]
MRDTAILTQHLHIKYPRVEGLADKSMQNSINDIFYSSAFKLWNGNTALVKKSTKGYSYYVDYSVTRRTDGFISVRFEESLNLPFYAHPFNKVCGITVNLKDGSIYSLKDLFKPGSNYRTVLNSILKEGVEAQAKKINVPLLAEFKGIDKDQEFYLTRDSIVVYWQQAVYLPSYLGALKVKVPYSKIPIRPELLK